MTFSRFDEFDEAIEEAIEEDVKEAEGGGETSSFRNLVNVEPSVLMRRCPGVPVEGSTRA